MSNESSSMADSNTDAAAAPPAHVTELEQVKKLALDRLHEICTLRAENEALRKQLAPTGESQELFAARQALFTQGREALAEIRMLRQQLADRDQRIADLQRGDIPSGFAPSHRPRWIPHT